MALTTEPPVWIVAVVDEESPFQVRAAGPFSSFETADAFRANAIKGLSPEEAELYGVVVLESIESPDSFAAGND
jgi:hypothetical protein